MTVAAGRPPYGAYTTIVSVFGGGLALAGALAHALHRDPREHDALDLLVLGAATFKASRTIARDEVTSFLRDPFVEGKAHEGDEDPVETGDMAAGARRVRHLLALHRHVGRRGPRVHADPGAALRAPPDPDAGGGRVKRLRSGRVRPGDGEGRREAQQLAL